MVKTKIKKLLLYAIIGMILLNAINAVYAAGPKLIFSDVDVKVSGKTSNNLKDGDRIGNSAEPNDNIEFRVKVQNNFTSEQNIKIKEITVKVTIQGIDNGDSLENESFNFDLSPGNDRRVTLKFQVPLEVSEDTFDAIIHAEGRNANNTGYESEMRLKLEVDKKSHMVVVTQNTLTPSEISCNRNVHLAATLINIGNNDEKSIDLQIQNSKLGINLHDTISELRAQPNEPESRFSKTYLLHIPDDAAAGAYPITLSAPYGNNIKRAEAVAALTISDCKTPKKEMPKETNTEENDVVVISPPIEKNPAAKPDAKQNEVPFGTVVTQESFLKSNTFIVGIIIAEVIAVIAGIALVVKLFGKKS